ncbi:carboxypeptidase regulatory-like domain-containing protein [Telmatocola sphagniphila]|uniref:Carboxypeptidase regulatory-like domain-containing protein n=1 Tax=Telmatocola sphagniphila TaxID=1123043 RepID=A0A8E6B7V5_9BACT|nr:hypothetical protein [Telmatocola sphagniphila]QVL32736.1 carboxypeptidase regulatory-like domain-containing protein [Telmatocola sphagniphila]
MNALKIKIYQSLKIVIMTILMIPLSGCVLAPIPNSRVEGFAVQSRLLDAETKQPIPNAKIIAVDGDTSITDSDGRFELKKHTQQHYGFLLGVISYPVLPFTTDLVSRSRAFRVNAVGYPQQSFLVKEEEEGIEFSKDDPFLLIKSELLLKKKVISNLQSDGAKIGQ